MIWFFLILVALTAVLLLFNRQAQSAVVDPLDHYRAQLDEIADDEARGVLDEESARAAKLEVERRILKAAKAKASAELSGGDKRAPALIAVLALVAAFGLYAVMGRPGLPAKPGLVVSNREAPIEDMGITYGEAIDKAKMRLEKTPDEQKSLQALALLSRQVRDFSTAANAFAELARLEPENHAWRVQEFESMVDMARGQITPAARLVLGRLIEEAPEHPAGQYYLGLLRLQSGDEDGAKAVWQALADRSAPDAPWMPSLNNQLSKLGANPPKLSKEQTDAVAAMSPEDRQAFIKSMMERLEARLESAPDDAEGWLMLARSYLAMGNRDAAISALERGIGHVSAEKAAQLQALLDNLKANPDL